MQCPNRIARRVAAGPLGQFSSAKTASNGRHRRPFRRQDTFRLQATGWRNDGDKRGRLFCPPPVPVAPPVAGTRAAPAPRHGLRCNTDHVNATNSRDICQSIMHGKIDPIGDLWELWRQGHFVTGNMRMTQRYVFPQCFIMSQARSPILLPHFSPEMAVFVQLVQIYTKTNKVVMTLFGMLLERDLYGGSTLVGGPSPTGLPPPKTCLLPAAEIGPEGSLPPVRVRCPFGGATITMRPYNNWPLQRWRNKTRFTRSAEAF